MDIKYTVVDPQSELLIVEWKLIVVGEPHGRFDGRFHSLDGLLSAVVGAGHNGQEIVHEGEHVADRAVDDGQRIVVERLVLQYPADDADARPDTADDVPESDLLEIEGRSQVREYQHHVGSRHRPVLNQGRQVERLSRVLGNGGEGAPIEQVLHVDPDLGFRGDRYTGHAGGHGQALHPGPGLPLEFHVQNTEQLAVYQVFEAIEGRGWSPTPAVQGERLIGEIGLQRMIEL